MAPVFAASFQANLAFGLFLLIAAFGFVLGFFTIRGSGIDNHPWDGREGAPGSKLPDEFHQFADRQTHDADLRRAARDRRVEARLMQARAETQASPPAAVSSPAAPPDDMSMDDINRRLAEEARARKQAGQAERDIGGTPQR